MELSFVGATGPNSTVIIYNAPLTDRTTTAMYYSVYYKISDQKLCWKMWCFQRISCSRSDV